MELKEFTAKPCHTELAIEFLPKHPPLFRLSEVAKRLEENGITVELNTPVFLALKIDGKNVSLFKSGKIMVKETRDEETARVYAQKLVQLI